MAGRTALVMAFVFALAAAGPAAYAQDDAREKALRASAKVDRKAIDAAVKKGCEWLKPLQGDDGSWKTTAKDCRGKINDRGTTALVLLALLKGGHDPDAKCIKKGFNYIFTRKPRFRRVYEVSVLILALAARCQPPEKIEEKRLKRELKKKNLRTSLFEPPEKRLRKNFRNAPPLVRKWLKEAVKWLISVRNPDGGWGYGLESRTDASNTQYAVLAFHAATRCGVNTPPGVFAGFARYMLLQQQKKGPEVPGFPVPVADFEIKKLRKMEKELLESMCTQVEEAREKGEKITPDKLKKLSTSLEIEDPYGRFGVELKKMYARGWAYLPQSVHPNIPPDSLTHRTIGSMTCSGVAALCVAKANLEGTIWYRKNKKAVNKGIRDGCAWLARNFTVKANPRNGNEWHYYHLYGLERAGMLSLVRKFGKHNWYSQGANLILGQQKDDGSWPGELGRPHHPVPGVPGALIVAGNLDPMIITCFAVLFLKRATAPVVRVENPYTGADLFGPRKSGK